MILRATFENIYSIKDETQISFVAGKSNAHPSHVSRAEKRDDISVLKAGIVYGANASGKSNVIKAIALLQQIVPTETFRKARWNLSSLLIPKRKTLR